MNKEDIIKLLNQYNFDKNKFVVISGAAMVLLGIKPTTNDIDISVTPSYCKYLLNKYNCILEKEKDNRVKVYFIDNVINFSTDYFDNNLLFIEDIPVQSIDNLLLLKQSLNREKDKKDIELINIYKEGK